MHAPKNNKMSLSGLGENTPFPPTYRESPIDWGRGDRSNIEHPKIERQVSFHYGSMPMASEMYDVTNLRKSNVRLNDQLLPKPTDYPIGNLQPQYHLPADHPYTSHIERTSMFPDPATTLTRANTMIGLVDEMRERAAKVRGDEPAAPYEATFVEKVRGHPWRRETVQSAIPNSELQPKKFADPYANNFNVNRLSQPLYSENGVYPTPPNYQNPNSPFGRDQEIGVSPRTGQAASNVYYGDRLTHYSLQFTGNGPADSLIIDSNQTPVPQSTNTFISPRPLSGRGVASGPASRSRPIYCKAANGEEFCTCWYCCEERAAREHRFGVQQMEAQNRLHLLNSQSPMHNIIELRRKYAAVGVPKSGPSQQSPYLPQIFYNHMGTYLAERSGLYRPRSYSIDAEENYGQLYQQIPLQFYVKEPRNGELPSTVDNPYLKQGQFVQDGKRVQTDSDYGATFNSPTFLQENALLIGSRGDATSLMSKRNEDLRRVASMSSIPLAPEPENLIERRGFNNPVTNAYLGGPIGGPEVQGANWRPLCGVPWPHFNMAIYQNSFNRSAIHSDFHARFPERAPDLRENVSTGRRHDFDGFNAQELRGTLTPRTPNPTLLGMLENN